VAAPKERQQPNVLGNAILQLLSRSPASGYDLKARFYASIGRGWHAYDTQIYRELKSLEQAGYTTGRVVKGRAGPERRMYSITPRGKAAIAEWLASPMDLHKVKDEFALRVWSADLFPPGAFEQYLRDAREEWATMLENERMSLRVLVAEHGEPDGAAPANVFGRQLGIEFHIMTTEARLAWIDRALKVIASRADAGYVDTEDVD
jgi:PadR family transcriptional regulator AphA